MLRGRLAVVLGLGLSTSCREPERPVARAQTPSALQGEATATTAASVAAPSASPRAAAGPNAPELRISGGVGWARAAEAELAERPATRGGYRSLNQVGDELRALAADCRCTSDLIDFRLDDQVNTEDVLARLGLLKSAGFTRARVWHRGTAIVFQHAEASDRPALRVLSGGAFCSTTESAEPADLHAVEDARLCAGALLSVAEEAEFAVAWRAAQALTHGRAPSVRFVLDSQPRTPSPPQPPSRSGAMVPVGRIDFRAINKRIKAQYADLYDCLVRFPVPASPPAMLAIDFSITANGTTTGVNVIDPSAVPETAACLRSGFESMVFRVPRHGAVKLRFPFPLTDQG